MTFADWYCETVVLFVYAAVVTICLWQRKEIMRWPTGQGQSILLGVKGER